MRRHLIRIVSLGVVTALITTGCMLTRGIDRAFLGMVATTPKYQDRKVTGLILLPIGFSLDVVTFPLQVILIFIFGDSFPYRNIAGVLNDNPRFQRLSEERKLQASAELTRLLRSNEVSLNTALALGEDGRWVVVKIDDAQRAQLFARAGATTETLALVR